jgi:hypothetical protein
MKRVTTTLRHLAQHITAAQVCLPAAVQQEILMKHNRTLLASSIVAAFVGASGLSFAQSAMMTDPLARDANGNPNVSAPYDAAAAELTQPTPSWADAPLQANATAESRVDLATGPEAPAALQPAPSNQLATAADRVERETGQTQALPYEAYSVDVAAAEPAVTAAEPQVAIGLTEDSSPLAPYDSSAESRVALATGPESSSTLAADDVFLSEYAKAEPSPDVAPAAESAGTPTYEPPVRTDTAAPTSTSIPVTGDYDTPRSQPPVYATPVDDEEVD